MSKLKEKLTAILDMLMTPQYQQGTVMNFPEFMQIRLHVNIHSWLKKLAARDPMGIVEGVSGHILNCGKTATNTMYNCATTIPGEAR